MNRKSFLSQLSVLSLSACLPLGAAGTFFSDRSFANRLKPIGRVLELEGYYVWCNSPIIGDDGKVHLFFSRWDSRKGMGGWIRGSEIAHAVAPAPEGPYEVVGTVLAPREGFFDSTTCHNPLITKVDDRYCLFYMGNSNGKTNTKRIGLATAPSLYGPWQRTDSPLLEAGVPGAWDDHCTTNPAFIRHPNGQYWLLYKSWNTADYERDTGAIRGNRKYGLAIADKLEGPYRKYEGNPIIDFSARGENRQFEDAYVWRQRKRWFLIARDMGLYGHDTGLLMESRDGIHWSEPEVAYRGMTHYGIVQPPPPAHLKKYGRFERPQVLLRDGKPAYLFTTTQGGKYMTASPFIFQIT